jgi:hypothetical protein
VKRTTTASGKVVPEVASRGQTVGELIAELQRYPPEAELVGDVGGHHVPRVFVGVGQNGKSGDPVVVVADREPFPGRLPDTLLERGTL